MPGQYWWQWCFSTDLPTDRSVGRSPHLQHSSQLLTECNQTTMAVPNPVKADNSQTGEAAAGRRRGRGCLVTHARSLGGAGATSVRAGLRRRRPGRFLPPQTTSSSHCWLIFFFFFWCNAPSGRTPDLPLPPLGLDPSHCQSRNNTIAQACDGRSLFSHPISAHVAHQTGGKTANSTSITLHPTTVYIDKRTLVCVIRLANEVL